MTQDSPLETRYVIWKDDYSVNNELLDTQHKQIINMLNNLYNAIKENIEPQLLDSIIEGLIEYTRTHFRDEEKIMQAHEFPEYEKHRNMHDILKRRTEDYGRIKRDHLDELILELFKRLIKFKQLNTKYSIYNL